jgi:hypothetical protein
MPLDFVNIVPQNNLRLPDALSIQYGPARSLSRFVLAADRAARRKGVFLRVRHDFSELLYVNRHYAARDMWYSLVDGFNPECADICPENSFWVSGEDENGEVAVTAACRIYDWSETSLAEEARAVWYGRDQGQPCIVTAEAAARITGLVAWGGASWVRPDFRGRHLSYLIPRVLKAYSCSRWPIDCLFCFIGAENVKRGLAANYGHQNLSHSVHFRDSPHGEQVVGYTLLGEFYAELANFMATGGSIMEPGDFDASAVSTGVEHIVTKTSADEVFQGSISLS